MYQFNILAWKWRNFKKWWTHRWNVQYAKCDNYKSYDLFTINNNYVKIMKVQMLMLYLLFYSWFKILPNISESKCPIFHLIRYVTFSYSTNENTSVIYKIVNIFLIRIFYCMIFILLSQIKLFLHTFNKEIVLWGNNFKFYVIPFKHNDVISWNRFY